MMLRAEMGWIGEKTCAGWVEVEMTGVLLVSCLATFTVLLTDRGCLLEQNTCVKDDGIGCWVGGATDSSS
jgi:hypothetical protein